MILRIEPLRGATFGAVVTGIDLARFDDAQWACLERAYLDHGVLIFPGQHLTLQAHTAFAKRFGELELMEPNPIWGEEPRPVIIEISNVADDGTTISDPTDPRVRFHAANEGWHSDSSFRQVRAKVSVICCVEAATNGGATGFADMRAAYDALDDELRGRLEPLEVWHSLVYSQAVANAVDGPVPDDPWQVKGARHRLVSRHPETGRPSLFIGRHASAVATMSLTDGQRLLTDLLDSACQPPRTHHHRWTNGDVVVYDNRCILHRATPYDLRERRRLRHIRVTGG